MKFKNGDFIKVESYSIINYGIVIGIDKGSEHYNGEHTQTIVWVLPEGNWVEEDNYVGLATNFVMDTATWDVTVLGNIYDPLMELANDFGGF